MPDYLQAPKPDILVAQLGARRHYAVPIAFASRTRLARFCTDFYVESEFASWWLQQAGTRLGVSAFRRLAGRHAPGGLESAVVSSFWGFALWQRLHRSVFADAATQEENWIPLGQRFSSRCASQLNNQTRGVYAFTSAALELFLEARRRGISTWLDHATAPRSYEMALVAQEAERYPGWARAAVSAGQSSAYEARQQEELALADIVICGSTFAKRAVETLGTDSSRIRVVPLGFRAFLPKVETGNIGARSGRSLNVLFAGGEGLRKGIGYLQQALARLGSFNIKAKAAGDLDLSEMALGVLARDIELLGPVPRSEMTKLLHWADVLVLPSISDTFGIVILEALGHGVPVIATDHTGAPDVLREGLDGFVVPVRSVDVIADRLERLALSPDLLASMKAHARQRARDFDLEHYARRLIAAVSGENV